MHHMEVAATCTSFEEVLQKSATHTIDVAVLDRYLGDVDLLSKYTDLNNALPTARLVIFTAFPDVDDAGKAIKLGFRGYLDKGRGLQATLLFVEKVYNGEVCVDLTKSNSKKKIFLDSDQEKVLAGILIDLTNKEIAHDCDRSESWFYEKQGQLFNLFHVDNKAALVNAAFAEGRYPDRQKYLTLIHGDTV